MKIFKNKINLVVVALLLIISGCETADLNQLNDPSSLTPGSADPQLLINNVQLRFMNALAYNEDNEDGLNVRAAEAIRMQHLFGAYAGPFSLSAGNQDDLWEDFYKETLNDIKTLIPIAEAREQVGVVAVAKIFQAMSYVYLVDTYGKVPFSEALQGNDNPNPVAEDGEVIYNAMFDVLDEAITALNTPNLVMPINDLFYGGDASKWIKAARTIKFKMYNQMRLIGDYSAEINTLIGQGLINSIGEDLQFQYSTVQQPNDSRHPYFALNYDADGADDYMNNYYMYQLKDAKGFNDPRLRYYFYRQIEETPTGDDLECEGASGFNFCHIGDYYWGRDHGDDDGVPPDGLKRSTYGLYPVGGAFDGDQFATVSPSSGAQGAGIFPLMLSSYVKFLLAESALMSGTTGNPRSLLEEGIRESMTKVLTFNTGLVTPGFGASPEDVNNYVDYVLGEYDAASDNDARLDIIMKEYYIALWGNGIEAWNNYRRTSFPSDLEPHVNVAGEFPRTFMYPAGEVNTNSNISQKQVTEKVFWDINPDNLQ